MVPAIASLVNLRANHGSEIYSLQEAGCSYYNPQLAPGTWTPELIPIERNAKEFSDCLLFVVTTDTRGVLLTPGSFISDQLHLHRWRQWSRSQSCSLPVAKWFWCSPRTNRLKTTNLGGYCLHLPLKFARVFSVLLLMQVIDDVNRGRKYLRELASRSTSQPTQPCNQCICRWNCPMFDNVEEATIHVIEMLKPNQRAYEAAQVECSFQYPHFNL